MKYVLFSTLSLPYLSSLLLGLLMLGKMYQRETFYSRITVFIFLTNVAGFMAQTLALLFNSNVYLPVEQGHLALASDINLDIYSGALVTFYCLLISLIAVFSRRYLHRDPGYFRFYFFLNLFGAGVQTILLASRLELLIVGWELVGVASAMLISFFYERSKPVEHGLRAFFTYRICDIGFVLALLLLHAGHDSSVFTGVFSSFFQTLPVPSNSTALVLIGMGLIWAAAGKSAQLPFSGWLPRAMEGPTPSSAIFYGAISVHLGAFLLLRFAPLIEASPTLQLIIIGVGGATALHSTLVGRVQTDIKCSLAYASLTQVSVIWIEIALGFYSLAVLHMIGHAAVRSLQILKSPSALHDHQHLEEALGTQIPPKARHIENLVPRRLQLWLYRQSLDRGFAEAIIRNWLFYPIIKLLQLLEKLDQKWVRLINKTSET